MNQQSEINKSQENLVSAEPSSQNSLYTVFRYIALGTGILGIGFLIALAGLLLTGKIK